MAILLKVPVSVFSPKTAWHKFKGRAAKWDFIMSISEDQLLRPAGCRLSIETSTSVCLSVTLITPSVHGMSLVGASY